MQRTRKAGFQAPDISFFVPSLADELDQGETTQAEMGQIKWQPRWTILFSLSSGVLLWAGIIWLIRLL